MSDEDKSALLGLRGKLQWRPMHSLQDDFIDDLAAESGNKRKLRPLLDYLRECAREVRRK